MSASLAHPRMNPDSVPPWPDFLKEHFPGFLLPDTERSQISRTTARRFLSRLDIPPATFELLRASSLLAAHGERLIDLAQRWLPALLRVLPSRTLMYRRTWRGGFQGRLDVPRTQALHLSGQADGFVTLARHRDIHLPENIFLCTVLARTTRLLEGLRKAKLLTAGWAAPFVGVHAGLRNALDRTALRDLTPERPTSAHLQAAKHARHPCYGHALDWHRAMFESLDAEDPETKADLLAQGALAPTSEPKRFELACLVRLAMVIEQQLAADDPTGWTRQHSIVVANRTEVVRFEHTDGRRIDLFYDQAAIPVAPDAQGQRQRGLRHYFDRDATQRPDITLGVTGRDGVTKYVVFEVKYSDDLDYIASGYDEAIVYRHEYGAYLADWPKAVLISPREVSGALRRQDQVVAVGWRQLNTGALFEDVIRAP